MIKLDASKQKPITDKAIQEEATTETVATQGELSTLGEIIKITIHIEGVNAKENSILEGEI